MPLRPSRRRQLTLAVVVALVLAALVPSAAAQNDIDSARSEREEIRRDKADKAADLDPLLAEDAELEQAVADLDSLVELQEAKLDATRQAIVVAEASVVDSEARVAAKQVEIGDLRELTRLQAVEAYVKPNGDIVQQVLTAADLTTAARRRALLRSVSTSQADLLDQLRAAEDDLVEAEADAEQALADVEARKADEEAQLAELSATREEQLRLKAALEARIAEFQSEIDLLDAREEELTSLLVGLIAEEEARARAQQQIRIQAEQAQALAQQSSSPINEEDPDAPVVPQPTPPPPEPLPAPPSASGMSWPGGTHVTSPFGFRWGRLHSGVDINAPGGTPIVAAKGGTVVFAGDQGWGLGLNIVIDHGGGFTTTYAHLSSMSVGVGQSVGQGSQIGASGCTGSCTGDHLHFETRVNGVAQDPMSFL